MIDSHCHLDEFPDLERKIASAKQVGVTNFISCSSGVENSKRVVNISKQYEEIYAAIGLGYENSFQNLEKIKIQFAELFTDKNVVAVGECGLDKWNGMRDSTFEKQKELLKFHLELAKQTDLPMVIHCRSAFEEIFSLVNHDKVQMHCFTGNLDQMKIALDRGWYISLGGILTFKSSHSLRELAKYIPDDRLLIETDSPYLSPEPYRGQPNSPANVKIIAEVLARVRQTTIEKIDQLTTNNTKRLFKI
jgi:TatD DNase family protein